LDLKNLLQAIDEGRPQLLRQRHDLHPEGANSKTQPVAAKIL